MIKRPKWSSNDHPKIAVEWVVEEAAPGLWLVRSEETTKLITGRLASLLLPRLDGTRTIAHLLKELKDTTAAELLESLDALESENLIERSPASTLPTEEAAYWRLLELKPPSANSKKRAIACSVHAMSDDDPKLLIEMLKMSGIAVSHDAEFKVVITRDIFDRALKHINDQSFQSRMPWMLVRPYGRRQWIGPIFAPNRTPCWECLSWWLNVNGWLTDTVVANWAVQTQATLALAGTLAARWLTSGECSPLYGQILEFDSGSFSFDTHKLLISPRCTHCKPSPELKVSLSDTCSRLTGVTERVDELGRMGGLSVYAGKTSQLAGIDGEGRRYYCDKQCVFGVAESVSAARASCLAEGVERYSARFGRSEQIFNARFSSLARNIVHPRDLLFEDDPDIEDVRSWVPAESLVSGETWFLRKRTPMPS